MQLPKLDNCHSVCIGLLYYLWYKSAAIPKICYIEDLQLVHIGNHMNEILDQLCSALF